MRAPCLCRRLARAARAFIVAAAFASQAARAEPPIDEVAGASVDLLEKGGFRHARLPDWPETTVDLGPIQAEVAREAATRCGTRLAATPLDLGEAQSFAAKFAQGAASTVAQKALGNLLGGFMGGGSAEKKPPLYKDPVKSKQKSRFVDPATDTRIDLGGIMASNGLLLSSRVDKAAGKGTFHTIFLEQPDCTRIWPTRQMGYAMWGKWSLDVSITKTTRSYQDGVLVSENVEQSGWSKSGTFDFSRGVALIDRDATGSFALVLDPDQAYLAQLRREIEMPLWREMGYGQPVEGLRSVGAHFENVAPGELGSDTVAVIHVTRIDNGRYTTVGFALPMTVGADGAVTFTQL